MRRLVLLAAAALLAVVAFATVASARSDAPARVSGVVALKAPASQLVTVRTKREAVSLRVPGSLATIRIGRLVELRGSTLRARGKGSQVLARNVTIASTGPLGSPTASARDDDEFDDDEIEITGNIVSLSPLTVSSRTRTARCAVPAGFSLAGFAAGDLVEMTCDLKGGNWVLCELEHEDDDGPGGGKGDDDDDDDDDDDEDGDDDDGPGDDD